MKKTPVSNFHGFIKLPPDNDKNAAKTATKSRVSRKTETKSEMKGKEKPKIFGKISKPIAGGKAKPAPSSPSEDVETTKSVQKEETPEIEEFHDYEDDFEDYTSDFESEDESKIEDKREISEVDVLEEERKNDLIRAMEAENKKVSEMPVVRVRDPTSDDIFKSTIAAAYENFEIARKERMKESKMKTRAEKILSMIKLDVMSFKLFEMAPMPYDIFMKYHAGKNARQISTQTNEDVNWESCQTEEIPISVKWTQHPPSFRAADITSNSKLKQLMSGVGDELDELTPSVQASVDWKELTHFMKTVGNKLINLLREENASEENFEKSDTLPISDAFLRLPTVREGGWRKIEKITSFGLNFIVVSEEEDGFFLSIWDVRELIRPSNILSCRASPACVDFYDPYVFTGNEDGSIYLWNTEERFHLGNSNGEIETQPPSYVTGVSKSVENAVVAIRAVKKNSERQKFSPITICSLELDGILTVWTLSLGNQNNVQDSGSAPWSKIRFLKNKTILLSEFIPREFAQTTSMTVKSEHRIYIGTDDGSFFQCSLYGGKESVKLYGERNASPGLKSTDCIEICFWDDNYFLVSGKDVKLFRSGDREPILNLHYGLYELGKCCAKWIPTDRFVTLSKNR